MKEEFDYKNYHKYLSNFDKLSSFMDDFEEEIANETNTFFMNKLNICNYLELSLNNLQQQSKEGEFVIYMPSQTSYKSIRESRLEVGEEYKIVKIEIISDISEKVGYVLSKDGKQIPGMFALRDFVKV